MGKRQIRKLGAVTDDLEKILEEMSDTHDMQCGEVLALVYNWLRVHRPDALEEYEDGSSPVFFYGPKD